MYASIVQCAPLEVESHDHDPVISFLSWEGGGCKMHH